MPSVFTACLALAVACVAAQCPDHLINRTRCNPVESVIGPDAETCFIHPDFQITKALDWAFECQLPIEVRVGVTMSLTGNYSNPGYNAVMLQVLQNWSSQISTQPVAISRDDIALGEIKMCTRFCVMDDESSEAKVVDLYRSFSGDGNSTRSTAALLLGPSTHRFRNVAAQVANDYQKPMLLWSLPKELRNFPVGEPKDWRVAEVIETIELPTVQNIRDEIALAGGVGAGIHGTLYDYPNYTCGDFPVPSGYYLRTGAELLSCDGPCDPVADLDLCCRPQRGLSVSGSWTPNHALVSGGWQDGCLRGQSLANETTNMSLVLNFERSPAAVTFAMEMFNAGGTAPVPYLVLAEQVYGVETGSVDMLPDNTALSFDYLGDAEVHWEVCLRESCTAFQCPASLYNQASSFCEGTNCTSTDVTRCCSADPEDLNGIMWGNGFTSVFDLVAPASEWARDVIQQTLELDGRMLCVAQHMSSSSLDTVRADDVEPMLQDFDGHFFTNLCHHYARMVGEHQAEVMLAQGPLSAVSAIVRLNPSPTMVLVCGPLNFYMGFLHASQMVAPNHGTVVSCIPFGSLLDSVRGFELNFRSLEPQPWPSFSMLQTFKLIQPLGELASLRLTFSEAYTLSQQQFNGSFPTELLFLYSSWQVIDRLAMRVAESVLSYSFLLQRGRRDCIISLILWTFSTYLGQIDLVQQGFRAVKRIDVATRQFVPLTVADEDAQGLAANVSWTLKMVQYFRSDISVADIHQPILKVTNEVDSNAWYPCPEGCVVRHTHCSPCPPGTYRSMSLRQCVPCLPGTYQNNYAASTCNSCPVGASCNVTGSPLAEPGYFALRSQESMIYELWNGPDACSIGPGGGLANLHPSDIGRWSASKESPEWQVQECKPKSACLGENQCSAQHEGPACTDCAPGYSKRLVQRDVCTACPSFWSVLNRCMVFAWAQVAAILVLVWASHRDPGVMGCLWCPVLTTLLSAMQIFWMLLEIMARAKPNPEVLNDGLRRVLDPYMMPFLLPLLDCADDGFFRSVENQSWAVLASAISIYVLALVFWLLMYLWTFIRGGNISVKSFLVAANHVVLPCLVYWTFQKAFLCANPEANCDERHGLQEPHIVSLMLVCVFLFLEGYALWISRHDFFHVSFRADFGLLATGIYREYLWWPVLEFTYLLFLTAAQSISDAWGLPAAATFWTSVILQGISYVMTVSGAPYLFRTVPRLKNRVNVVAIMLSISFSVNPILVESWGSSVDQIDQLLAQLYLLSVFFEAAWILFMNRVLIPYAVMEHTYYPFKYPELVGHVCWLFGLHRVKVTKGLDGIVQLYADQWSKSQRRDISWSIAHIIGGRLMATSMLRMGEVYAVLEAASRALLRSHKAAYLLHFNAVGPKKVAIAAFREGKTTFSFLEDHAFILAYELSIAVHDMNIDKTDDEFKEQSHNGEAFRVSEFQATGQQTEGSEAGETDTWIASEVAEENPGNEVARPKTKAKPQVKLHLVRSTWHAAHRPRNRRVSSAADAFAVARGLGSATFDDDDVIEKRLWDARKRCKMLESKLPVMLKGMAGTREAVAGLKSEPIGWSHEVKQVLAVLNEIQMYADSVGAENISENKLIQWICHVELVTRDKDPDPELEPPSSPPSDLMELLGEETNEGMDLETRATSTMSRSQSEDSLERQLRPQEGNSNLPLVHVLAARGKSDLQLNKANANRGADATAAASMAIMKSKPRRVGKSTARLHWK